MISVHVTEIDVKAQINCGLHGVYFNMTRIDQPEKVAGVLKHTAKITTRNYTIYLSAQLNLCIHRSLQNPNVLM
jgi:hypothetical protein